MSVKLLTEHRLEFVSLKRGCTGLSESTLVVGNHKSRLNLWYIGFEPMSSKRWVHSYLKEKEKNQTSATNLVFHACSTPFHAQVH